MARTATQAGDASQVLVSTLAEPLRATPSTGPVENVQLSV